MPLFVKLLFANNCTVLQLYIAIIDIDSYRETQLKKMTLLNFGTFLSVRVLDCDVDVTHEEFDNLMHGCSQAVYVQCTLLFLLCIYSHSYTG